MHRTGRRHRKDVAREAAFRGAGLEYFAVVGADVHDPKLVVARMEETKARAGLLPQTWMLGPEPETLDQHLDHLDWLRSVEQDT